MKKLKQLDRLTILKCSSQSSLCDSIPPDVFMDIISRLPAKTIANCRRVSKSWASILRRPEFDELFLTKNPNRPLILFAFILEGGLRFFTSPQLQNPDDVNSSLRASSRLTYLPIDRFSKISPPVRGLLCVEDNRRKLVVCNPITGESITLPELKSELMWSKSVLGYDPAEKQFKVYCTTWSPHHPNTPAEPYVLTLGTGKMNWRMIECCKPYLPIFDGGICIDGILYHTAKLKCFPEDVVIVRVDVRFEKLSFIYKPKDMRQIRYESRLVNYKGRLGIFQSSDSRIIDGRIRSFEFWILEDAKKHEWKKQNYVLSPLWRKVVANIKLRIVGMTGAGEIVLSSYKFGSYHYLIYYNLEMNSVKRVGFGGFKSFHRRPTAHLFVDYLEDVKFV